jgi:hypothetical protein
VNRRSLVTTLSVLAGASGLLAALAGITSIVGVACTTDTDAGAITPITGIAIRADTLEVGFGCGTAPSQIYKYAAVVTYAVDAGPVCTEAGTATEFTGLFDCFADGVFPNLPACSTGSQAFQLSVYAYNQADYASADGNGPLESEVVGDPAAFAQLVASTATWTTTCEATQQANVEILAVCAPLTPNPGFVPQGDDGGTDGGTDGAADGAFEASSDAALDGGVDSAIDASDAAADVETGDDDSGGDAGDDGGDGGDGE